MFDVQGIEIPTPPREVFEFLQEPRNSPRWAHAFVCVQEGSARLETPAGTVDVGLEVSAQAETGTVDWRLTFPTGASASRSPGSPRPHAEPASTALSCTRHLWCSNTSRVPSKRRARGCELS
jgi:hypothetical protein